ncbi:glycerophosphodiester phosphodiesterase [Thauera phenylacetica]|nr:glycerophosphodiester phosphodiesterase [Thauera sp.]
MSAPVAASWPYPLWIAHRGAGRLAPENTLAAFALGWAHGYRMFECDARLSADGEVFLLHDDRLERTTDGRGEAVEQPWAALARLDAGAWHGPRHAGERLPTLAQVLAFCRERGCMLNVEIKPAPGDEVRTGRRVAQLLAAESFATPPLASSFSTAALAAAAAVAPALPRGLLLETFCAGWLDEARALGCVAVIAECAEWTPETAAQASAAGLRRLAYTVNDDAEAQRLRALGLDGLITDRVDHFRP